METCLVFLAAVGVCIYYPQPHMDEIFHIRQLETYLNYNFTQWDDKITTLPGLYLIYWLFLQICPLHNFFSLLSICRLLNSLLYLPISKLLRSFNPNTPSLILLYPALFMSSTLYYTDTLSLLAILLYYKSKTSSKPVFSFIFAQFSIFCRQTNIIWVGYFAGLYLFHKYHIQKFSDLLELFNKKLEILRNNIAEILIVIIFIIFLVVNKGITVGDRENHQMSLHLAQLCYLSALIAFYIPIDWAKGKSLVLSSAWVTMIPLVALAVHKFAYAHKFLLSDNSHYTFYIWKNVLSPYGVLLAPIYSLSFEYIKKGFSPIFYWWFLCCALVLVPSPLIEFRYFILPLTAYIITYPSPPSSLRILCLVLINSITMLIFLLKPYKGISFMW